MAYGACVEARLPGRVSEGARARDEWNVEIIPAVGGDEDRLELSDQSRRRFTLSHHARTSEAIDELREFLLACGGPAATFCIEDPTDKDAGVQRPWLDLEDVSAAEWADWQVAGGVRVPLKRMYEVLDVKRFRRVTKPRPDGFRVFVAGAEATDQVAVDFGRGYVTFPALPTSGRLSFSGRYDICVRLDGAVEFDEVVAGIHGAKKIDLIEVLGEEDYAPANATAEIAAQLGRTDEELTALEAAIKGLVAAWA